MSRLQRSRSLVRGKRGWVVVVLLFLFLGYAFGPDEPESSEPYDPASTQPDGLKALALLMGELGGELEVGPMPKGKVALLISDTLDEQETHRVEDWIRQGNTLVLTDLNSSFSRDAQARINKPRPRDLPPECPVPSVAGVTRIEPETDRKYPMLAGRGTLEHCFPFDDGYFMTANPFGRGSIVELGTPDIFTNKELGKADNSVLAANLLQPSGGNTITFLETANVYGQTSAEDGGITSVVSSKVWFALLQVCIAGILLLIWRGRRFGKPVDETQPVAVPGSQLTVAVGELMQTSSQSDGAARVLREDLRHTITDLLGLPPNTEPKLLAELASNRTGISSERLYGLLAERPLRDARDLTRFAQQVEEVQREVAHVR